METFEELKELATTLNASACMVGTSSRQLRETVRDLYKEALDNGEVDTCDF